MPRSEPGEIWLVDLGLAAKVRPAVILSDYPLGEELALLLIVPHTTSTRGTKWELNIQVPFLKPGVFHLQAFSRFLSRSLNAVSGNSRMTNFGL